MQEKKLLTLIVALTVGFVLTATALSWYRAGAQSRHYERQGIHLSQWDCFIGVKPAEKVIQIREFKVMPE